MKNPWTDISKPSVDLAIRLIDDAHPLNLYWGRDAEGRYLFVYRGNRDSVPEKRKLPKLVGVHAAVVPRGEESNLILVLNEVANWELFFSLCEDLVRATASTDAGPAAGAILLRRLSRWQEFLKRGKSEVLPLEQIKGLVGELLCLETRIVPEFGWDLALTFWQGPEETPQDFAVHQTGLEVKCQSGSSKPTVKVTSVEQLDGQLPEAYLVVYTLATAAEDNPGRFTLNGLVSRIRGALQNESESARERFEDLLFRTGYLYSEEYERYAFEEIAVKVYKIQEGFPRLLKAHVPPGIDRVSYTLALEACSGFEGTPDWWRTYP